MVPGNERHHLDLVWMKAPQIATIGTKQKALAINLDPEIYGSFAEIGQERNGSFFPSR